MYQDKIFDYTNKNGNVGQKTRVQMALSNQLTLCNNLNGRNNLGFPELKAAMASKSNDQRDDAFVFLECNKKELAGLPNGRESRLLQMCVILGLPYNIK